MIRKAVLYKNVWLVEGSRARTLYDEKRWKDLDIHLAQLTREQRERGEIR